MQVSLIPRSGLCIINDIRKISDTKLTINPIPYGGGLGGPHLAEIIIALIFALETCLLIV